MNCSDSAERGAAHLTICAVIRFYKTRQCSFFEKGKCNRGSNCKYAHGTSESLAS